jgi:hypothetical protein
MHLNRELGIPQTSDYYTEMGYANAGGRGWWKTKVIFVGLLSAPVAAYMALSNNDKSRYKTVMGNISSPPQHLIKQYYAATKSQFPYDAKMSSEQLQSLVEQLTNEYSRWGSDADSKAATVARNRKSLDKGDNKQIIAEIAAVRSWMYAINQYRAEVVKAYDKAFAREEKAAIEAEEKAARAAEAAAKTETKKPTGLPLPPLSAPIPTMSMVETGGSTIGETTLGGEPKGTSGLLQGEVNVGGKPVKKSFIGIGVGVLAAATIGYFVLRRK